MPEDLRKQLLDIIQLADVLGIDITKLSFPLPELPNEPLVNLPPGPPGGTTEPMNKRS